MEQSAEELIRLNKYISQAGVCSRRDADKLIEEGRVSVNGETATFGMKVSPSDMVKVDGEVILPQTEKKIVAFYKPVGVTCTERDEHADVIIEDVFKYPERLTYAGRLDRDSEGLLIMTNDGDLVDKMMRARNFHEKEYEVTVNKAVDEDFLSRMSKGVFLRELNVKTRPCKIVKTGRNSFKIILTQGLNRQIRRMCAECGFEVKKILRIRVMNILLGDLKPGEFREIVGEERDTLIKGVNKSDGR